MAEQSDSNAEIVNASGPTEERTTVDDEPAPPEPEVVEPKRTRGRPKGSKNKPRETLQPADDPQEEYRPPSPLRPVRISQTRPSRNETPVPLEPINSRSIADAMLTLLGERDTYRREQKRALYKSFLE